MTWAVFGFGVLLAVWSLPILFSSEYRARQYASYARQVAFFNRLVGDGPPSMCVTRIAVLLPAVIAAVLGAGIIALAVAGLIWRVVSP